MTATSMRPVIAAGMVASIVEALSFAFGMTWEILWALVLGFALSAVVQAVVSKEAITRLLPNDSPRSIPIASEFHLSFQRAPRHQPPMWPDPASSMQLHVHFRVGDPDEAERTVLALGGTKFDPQHQPERSRVFADPAGPPSASCR